MLWNDLSALKMTLLAPLLLFFQYSYPSLQIFNLGSLQYILILISSFTVPDFTPGIVRIGKKSLAVPRFQPLDQFICSFALMPLYYGIAFLMGCVHLPSFQQDISTLAPKSPGCSYGAVQLELVIEPQ